MIHKVSNQNSRLLSEVDGRLERESMNKSAMDSFSQVVVASAKGLIAKGDSLEDVAAKFNLSTKMLAGMLEGEQPAKLVCACDEEYVPEMKSATRKVANKKTRELTAEEVGAIEAYNSLHNIKQAGTPNLPTASSKRILSGKGNDQSDFGGARKQMGYERNNSIFDSEVIARQAKEQGNDEMLRAQSKKKAEMRAAAQNASRYETIDGESIVEQLKGVDQRKDAGIRSAGAQEAHKYNNKLPMNGISIFDTADFQRVPEKTAGDVRRAEIKEAAKAPKDRSWVETGSKSVTSNDIVANFIDSLLNKKG